VQLSLRLTVMIATASIATVPVLMAAHFSEVMVWSLAYAIAMNGVLVFGWSTAAIFEVQRRTAMRGD